MTQVKLWQIVSQTPNAIIFSDADGNLTSLPAGSANQVLVAGPDGAPMWADNSALQAALQAQTDAAGAIATAKTYTDAQITPLVGGAPLALDTLNELAQKLNGEETALNALIAQMETKASKDEVSTLASQTKQDAVADAAVYTDTAVSTAAGNLATSILQAREEAINIASNDASQKAATAQSEAISESNAYTENRLANVSNALTADAEAKVAALRNGIPADFQVEGTSTACFLVSSKDFDMAEATGDGLHVTQRFAEITGAGVAADDQSLNAKLLFVNGVAMSEDWTATKDTDGHLFIRMGGRLAQHVFDGSENALMLLAEYKSYNAITVKS